jgi:hypothetical protein
MQELVPPRMLGRVSSLDWLVSLSLLPLSYAIAGPVAAAIGAKATLAAGGTLSALVVTIGLFRPGVRDPEIGILGGTGKNRVARHPPEEEP